MTKLSQLTDVYPRPAKSLYDEVQGGWLASIWIRRGENIYITDEYGKQFTSEDKADLAAIERVNQMNERMKK